MSTYCESSKLDCPGNEPFVRLVLPPAEAHTWLGVARFLVSPVVVDYLDGDV